jgi:spermidine synthase
MIEPHKHKDGYSKPIAHTIGRQTMNFLFALFIAGGCGFISLSYEIVWFRAYSFVSGSSPVVFGFILGFYLLGIALGSLFSRRYCKDDQDPKSMFAVLVSFIFVANILGYLVVPLLAEIATFASWWWSLPTVALGAGALGAVLPLVSHYAVPPDDLAGARVSYLYLANILGSTLGSLTTGFILMDWFGMAEISLILLITGVIIGILVAAFSDPKTRTKANLAGAFLVIVALFSGSTLYGSIYEKMQYKEDYTRGDQFKIVVENRHGVITVAQDNAVYGGGAYDGYINTDLRKDFWLSRPFTVGALSPIIGTTNENGEPEAELLMIGLAAGSWAKIISDLPGIKKLTIIEINPGYEELIRQFDEVSPLLDNPKIEIIYDDGRRWLLRHPDEKFHAIIQNTTWHWRAHATNLLSQDYNELVKEHLYPGGLSFFNTTDSIDVYQTAISVWPYTMRVLNHVACSTEPIHFDPSIWKDILHGLIVDGKSAFPPNCDKTQTSCTTEWEHYDELLRLPQTIHEAPISRGLENNQSLKESAREGDIITDDNMLSEWRVLWHD